MKKAILLTIVFLSVSVFISGIFSQPQYYNYNSGGSGNAFPLNINTSTGKTIQTLYLPGAFNNPSPAPAGNITKLYMRSSNAGNATYTSLVIKMGQTTDVDLPTGAWYSGSMTTVFDQTNFNLTSVANDFFAITLQTPFAFNPAQSLVVEITQCGYSGTGITVLTTSLTGTKRHAGPLTVVACPHPWGNSSAITTHTGIDVNTTPPICSFTCTNQTSLSGTTNLLQAVSTVNNNICWIAGASATVRKTINGGANWTDANPNPGVINGSIYNMYAWDANNCLLTTSPGATFIYKTTNGGTNWTQVFTQAGGFIDGIVMKDANTGYAYGDPVGSRWSLWKTTDAGATWDSTGLYVPQAGSEAGWNNSMKLVGNSMWFGTNNTRVYYTTNLGANWLFGATTGNANSYCLQFNSGTVGLAGGSVMSKTTDGGATYSTITAPGTGNVTGLGGGAGTYYWYSRGNNLYWTTNEGTSWATAYTGTAALWGVDVQTVSGCPRGWAVGASGTVVKIGNDTLVAVNNNNNEVPVNYVLSQNYPNPFNPSTTISFGLPVPGIAKLVVYDMLGKEVKTLVNDYRSAGTYNISFDASNISSGVYFYTLTSGNFTESKKMMVIK